MPHITNSVMNTSVNTDNYTRPDGTGRELSPELIEAFERFIRNTEVTYLQRCLQRMLHEYIVSDEHPNDEYIREMVYQVGELFQLLEEMQDSNKSGF